LPSELIRAFIAIELPDSVRQALAREQEALRALLGEGVLRWVRPEGVHLTLRFLGETSKERLEQVLQVMREVAERYPALAAEVSGLGRFPSGSRLRVVWVGVREPTGALAALQGELESRLAKLGYPPEAGGFHPHLTLGRVRREASGVELRRLSEQLDGAGIRGLGTLQITHLALMRSQLSSGGAFYSRLNQVALRGPS